MLSVIILNVIYAECRCAIMRAVSTKIITFQNVTMLLWANMCVTCHLQKLPSMSNICDEAGKVLHSVALRKLLDQP